MKAKAPTITEAIEAHMLTRRHYSQHTNANDLSTLRSLARFAGNCRMADLTEETVEAYFATLDGLAPSSFNKARSRVDLFLKYCGRKKTHDGDPW